MHEYKFHKHVPCKQFGQNFLIDNSTIQDIVKLINPKKKEKLVEIGPGLAALTKPICELIDELIVIEVDYKLSHFLKNRSFSTQLKIFCQDALTFNYFSLFCKKKFAFLGIYRIIFRRL